MSRSNGTERAQRLNAAFDLLTQGHAVAQAAAMLTERVRLVAAPSLSLLAGGPGDQAPGAGLGTQRGHHHQGARGHRHEAARARARHGFDDRRRGLACRLGLVGSGAPAWLSATGAAKSASSIALIVCSAPSSNRPMTSWFPIAPAAPVGLARVGGHGHEDGGDLCTGIVRPAEGGQDDRQPDGRADGVRFKPRLQRTG